MRSAPLCGVPSLARGGAVRLENSTLGTKKETTRPRERLHHLGRGGGPGSESCVPRRRRPAGQARATHTTNPAAQRRGLRSHAARRHASSHPSAARCSRSSARGHGPVALATLRRCAARRRPRMEWTSSSQRRCAQWPCPNGGTARRGAGLRAQHARPALVASTSLTSPTPCRRRPACAPRRIMERRGASCTPRHIMARQLQAAHAPHAPHVLHASVARHAQRAPHARPARQARRAAARDA